MKLTKEYLEKLGCVPNGDGMVLPIGAARIVIRIYGERCYCELPGLYVGEITQHRLEALYFGLCGKELAPHNLKFGEK